MPLLCFFGRKNGVMEKVWLLESERQGFDSSHCLLLYIFSSLSYFINPKHTISFFICGIEKIIPNLQDSGGVL